MNSLSYRAATLLCLALLVVTLPLGAHPTEIRVMVPLEFASG